MPGYQSQMGQAGSAVGRLNDTLAEPTREAQMHQSMHFLNGTLDDMEQLVEALSKRLCVVLRPTAPTPTNPRAETVREVKAPFAESIDSVTARCRNINEHLNDLSQRLEV